MDDTRSARPVGGRGAARPAPGAAPPGVAAAEAALVEHYPGLVRLSYLVLPPRLGRHRRVLAAHAHVQRALPPRRFRPEPGEDAYALLRRRVLRSSLASAAGRLGCRPLPRVWGLRLFPGTGEADELALARALSSLPPSGRAAYALRRLERLGDGAVRELLGRTGVADPGAALAQAAEVDRRIAGGERLLKGSEFDPCTVQLATTDLMRRRLRLRLGALVMAITAALTVAALVGGDGAPAGQDVADGRGGSRAAVWRQAITDPARLGRTAPHTWRDTARMDFTAWAPRGGRTDDDALLRRALTAWAGGGATVRAAQGTPTGPPAAPPRLLFAGDVDGTAVVVLYDGGRLARYTEAGDGRAPVLRLARADDADITTAAAVAVGEGPKGRRYLTAPWVATAELRDLGAPGTPARALRRDADGVTPPVPAAAGDCSSRPALQLRSSSRIAEKHAFLLVDLGDITPVHLTYTPPPGRGPARSPREATGGDALVDLARTACGLTGLRDSGVRAVNTWEFARQPLPEGGGTARWVCVRADTWRGPGRTRMRVLPPAGSPRDPGKPAGGTENTAACSRFDQNVLATVRWRSKKGTWYVLAAGGRRVEEITARGDVDRTGHGPLLTAKAGKDDHVTVRARLDTGGSIAPPSAP